MVWFPCGPRDFQESSPAPQFKSINSLALSLLYGSSLNTHKTQRRALTIIQSCQPPDPTLPASRTVRERFISWRVDDTLLQQPRQAQIGTIQRKQRNRFKKTKNRNKTKKGPLLVWTDEHPARELGESQVWRKEQMARRAIWRQCWKHLGWIREREWWRWEEMPWKTQRAVLQRISCGDNRETKEVRVKGWW